jgi:hypothetical protein
MYAAASATFIRRGQALFVRLFVTSPYSRLKLTPNHLASLLEEQKIAVSAAKGAGRKQH